MTLCEEMEERVSAWLDGELEPEELSILEEHLAICPSCRRMKKQFQAVDRLGMHLPVELSPAFEERLSKNLMQKPSKPRITQLMKVAAGVLVLIALYFAVIVMTATEKWNAEAVAERVATVETLNEEALRDQNTILKTLEWDLKAMKLMISCSELDDEASEVLLNQIEDFLSEVNRVRLREGDDVLYSESN